MNSRKKIVTICGGLLLSVYGIAQKGKVYSAESYASENKYAKAVELLKEAYDPANPKFNEKFAIWAQGYLIKGSVYQKIASSKDAKVRKAFPNAAIEAFKALKKADSLDSKGRLKTELKSQLVFVKNALIQDGADGFNKKDFVRGYHAFSTALEIDKMKAMWEKGQTSAKVDTNIMYNTALAAYNAEMYDEGSVYFERLASIDYKKEDMYNLWVNSMVLKKDTVEMKRVLIKGIEEEVNLETYLTILVQLYLSEEKYDMALEQMEKFAETIKNPRLKLAQASIYDEQGNIPKAKVKYEEVIKEDPTIPEAHFNLGIIHYKKAFNLVKESGEHDMKSAKYKEIRSEAKEIFDVARNLFHNAFKYIEEEKSDPKKNRDKLKKDICNVLADIYYQLSSEKPEYKKKYEEYKEKAKLY